MRTDDVASIHIPVVGIISAPQDRELRDQLVAHLAVLVQAGMLRVWHEGCVGAGDDYRAVLTHGLDQARLIVVLISADLFASEQLDPDLLRALQRQQSGHTIVMSVVAKTCLWDASPLSAQSVLPVGRKRITAWKDRNAGWTAVVAAIRNWLLGNDDQKKPRVFHRCNSRSMTFMQPPG